MRVCVCVCLFLSFLFFLAPLIKHSKKEQCSYLGTRTICICIGKVMFHHWAYVSCSENSKSSKDLDSISSVETRKNGLRRKVSFDNANFALDFNLKEL